MKKSKRVKKILINILMLIFVVIIIYSLYHIISWKKDVDNNKVIKEKTNDSIKIDDENSEYSFDFVKLKSINKDTVGYIKVNNTNIDYVVVKGLDNEYYLNHNFENNYNIAGWIFADYHNKVDGNDKNLVIYGHNTADGSMFDTLVKVVKSDWYTNKDNYKILFATEEAVYYYSVFSTYTISVEEFYINTIFNSEDEFDSFVKKLKSRSVYDYGVYVYGNDKILTLSSCTPSGKGRVVLHAKMVEKIYLKK